MFGSNVFIIFILSLSLAASSFAAPSRSQTPKKNPMSRYFLATSFSHWQHGAKISDGTESFSFNGSSMALGLGVGYAAAFGSFSIITQFQGLLGSADLGFLSGSIPNIDGSFSGKDLGFFGGKVDLAFLRYLGEGVALGAGIPLMTTLYFKRNLGDGVILQNQDLVQSGAFIDFRLRRGNTVFNPKMGFIKSIRQYFVSMDYQWHF